MVNGNDGDYAVYARVCLRLINVLKKYYLVTFSVRVPNACYGERLLSHAVKLDLATTLFELQQPSPIWREKSIDVEVSPPYHDRFASSY